MITMLYLDPSDGNSYCKDCWVACYGSLPPTSDDMQPKGPANAPPPADSWAAYQDRSKPKSAPADDQWRKEHKQNVVDPDDSTANEDVAQAMVAQLFSALSDGASSSALIENIEGSNSGSTSFFTLLMSAKNDVQGAVFKDLPQIVAQLSNQKTTTMAGDVGGWLCMALVQRTLCCGNADKRAAATESIGRIFRHLKPDTVKLCVRDTIVQVRQALARTGKEATAGKLGSLEILKTICREGSNGAIEAVVEAKGQTEPNSAKWG